MATLNDLANQMDNLIKDIPVMVAKAKSDVAKVMIKELISTTPVDTSNALSNWRATWGKPLAGVISPYFLGKGGSTYFESVEEATLRALSSLSIPEVGRDVFLFNNVDYINALNTETAGSLQPGYFVERAELLAQEMLRNYQFKLPESL